MKQDNILLFSTGQDSFALKRILGFENKECLFVNMGTKENRIEETYIDKYFPGVIKLSFPLVEFELENKIIPFRNHFLALLGSQYAANIYFAFTQGDTTKDKDYVFKAQMEGVFNYFSLDTNKVRVQGPYTVHMPFKDLTKTEIVKLYLKEGYSATDLLSHSCSCYAGEEKACGVCRSCLRKFVSLELNDVNSESYFKTSPIPFLPALLQESKVKNRQREVEEIEQCMKKVKSK